MASIEQEFHVEAPPAAVWRVMADVERWPEWTPSMKRVKRLEDGPLAGGSRARLRIAGSLVESTWTVTSFEAERSFTWESNVMPGVVTVTDHELTPADGGTRVVLRVTFKGPLAPVAAAMLMPVSRRNVRLEGEGLKRTAEAAAASAAT